MNNISQYNNNFFTKPSIRIEIDQQNGSVSLYPVHLHIDVVIKIKDSAITLFAYKPLTSYTITAMQCFINNEIENLIFNKEIGYDCEKQMWNYTMWSAILSGAQSE